MQEIAEPLHTARPDQDVQRGLPDTGCHELTLDILIRKFTKRAGDVKEELGMSK